MKKKVFFLVTTLTICLINCTKKIDPCLQKWQCDDCACLFDKMQQNQHNPSVWEEMSQCYEKVCKK